MIFLFDWYIMDVFNSILYLTILIFFFRIYIFTFYSYDSVHFPFGEGLVIRKISWCGPPHDFTINITSLLYLKFNQIVYNYLRKNPPPSSLWLLSISHSESFSYGRIGCICEISYKSIKMSSWLGLRLIVLFFWTLPNFGPPKKNNNYFLL